jgi:tungstate transport system permease protein
MEDIIIQSIQQAIALIFSGDPIFYDTVYRSLYISGIGTLLSCVWSVPIAVVLGLYSFKGKWVIKGFFSALIGVPTVALGLLLFLLMSNQGEFGFLHLLFNVNGIVIGQAILVTPLIVSFSASALNQADTQLRDLAKTLGASGFRTNLTIVRETVWAIVLSITASFNRGFGELGIALIIGGNIFNETRTLTTSIALFTNFGEYSAAMAYAIILMTIVIIITLTINLIERLKKSETNWGKLTIWKSIGGRD